nr:MAG TPA: hypothetical protein [Caudoviricetes sp.]
MYVCAYMNNIYILLKRKTKNYGTVNMDIK